MKSLILGLVLLFCLNVTLAMPLFDNSSKYFNTTPVIFNFTVTDPDLWGYNLSCYNSGNTLLEFSIQEVDLTPTDHSVYSTHLFTNPGVKDCVLMVADSHTDNIFTPKIKLEKEWFGLGQEKIVIDDLIEFKVDPKSDVKLNKLSYSSKDDRISPVMDFEKKNVNSDVNIYWTISFDGSAYVRENSGYKGHILIIPKGKGLDSTYWYDAEDNLDSEVSFTLNKNQVKYHAIINKDKFNNNHKMYTESFGSVNLNTTYFSFEVYDSRNITVNVSNKFDNSSISDFNVRVFDSTLGFRDYVSTGYTIQIPVILSNTFLYINKSGYMNTEIFTISNGVPNSVQAELYEAIIKIKTYSYITGSLLADAVVYFEDTENPNINYSITNSSGEYIYYVNSTSNTDRYLFEATAPHHNPSTSYTLPSFGSLNPGVTLTQNIYLTKDFIVTFYREENGQLFNFSYNNKNILDEYEDNEVTVTLSIYCNDGAPLYYPVNTPTLYLNGVDCKYNYWSVKVEFPTDTQSWYRDIKPKVTDDEVSVFMLWYNDPDGDVINNLIVPLNDISDEYVNGYMKVNTYVNNSEQTVIYTRFDISNSATLFLDEFQRYNVYLINNDETKETFLGPYVSRESGVRTLTTPDIILTDQDYTSLRGLSYSINTDRELGLAYLNYKLNSSGELDISWSIYEQALNGSKISPAVYSVTLNNVTEGQASNIFSPLNSSKAYVSELYIITPDTRPINKTTVLWTGYSWSGPQFEGFDNELPESILVIVGLGIPIMVLLIFSSLSIEWGMFVSFFSAITLSSIGWYNSISMFIVPLAGGIMLLHVLLTIFGLLTLFALYRRLKRTA